MEVNFTPTDVELFGAEAERVFRENPDADEIEVIDHEGQQVLLTRLMWETITGKRKPSQGVMHRIKAAQLRYSKEIKETEERMAAFINKADVRYVDSNKDEGTVDTQGRLINIFNMEFLPADQYPPLVLKLPGEMGVFVSETVDKEPIRIVAAAPDVGQR